MNKSPYLSVVIPLFNETENIFCFFEDLEKELESTNKSYEIIFVDDGSTDNSYEVIQNLKKKHGYIRIIRFKKNEGKSMALAVGFEKAKGRYIVTIDADFQEDPADLNKLLSKIEEGYDLVSGWRKKRYDPPAKVIPSKLFNRFVSMMTGLKINDINCGFKIYKREVTQALSIYGEQHRIIPLLVFYKRFKIGEVEVKHRKRRFGRSKFTGISRCIHAFLDLFSAVFLSIFKRRPFHFFGSLGGLFFVSGFSIGLFLSIRYYLGIQYIGERMPLLILGVLLMVIGIQFISLGLLGDLIARGFISNNRHIDADKFNRYIIQEE